VALAGSWQAETDPDALIYHLALPQAWAAAHRIVARPEFDAAGFWHGSETVTLVPVLLGSPLAAKLLAWGWACLAAAVAAGLARAWIGEASSSWAGAAVLGTPRIMDLALHAKSDAAAAAFLAGAVLARARRGRGWVVHSGLLLGGAVVCKNTAVIGVPALLLTCAWLPRRRARSAARLLAASAVPVLPWLARNAIELGNPIAPLAWLPTLGRTALNASLAARYAFTWTDRLAVTPAGRALELLRLVGGMNAAIAIGLMTLLVRPRRLRGVAWLWAFCAVAAAGWCAALGGVARYLTPVVAPATAAALALWAGRNDWPRRIAMVSVAAGAIAFRDRPEFHGRAAESGLGTYAEAVTRAAAEAGPSGRVLVIGDARTYPASGRLRAQVVEDTPVMWAAVRASSSPVRLAVRMRQQGFTHVLYNLGQESFWAEYPAEFPWDRRMLDLYASFWDRRAVLLWHSACFEDANGYLLLYRLHRRAGERPFRAWLPGTAGEFAHLRRLATLNLSTPAVAAEWMRLDALFGNRPDWVARRGALEARMGQAARAAADMRRTSAFAPEAVAVWAEWSLPIPPAVAADPGRLAAVMSDRVARFEPMTRACLALGVPWAFVEPVNAR